MLSYMKMFGRMRIFRTITAPNMATGETKPKMHPGITAREALLTALRRFWLHLVRRDFRKVFARCFHRYLFRKYILSVTNQKLPQWES